MPWSPSLQRDLRRLFATPNGLPHLMSRLSLFPVLLLVSIATSGASFVDDRSLNDSQRYDRCLKLAHDDPDTAFEQAQTWHDTGGGPAAMHCSAVALVQLKQYTQAALKLDALAHERDAGSDSLRASLLDQAGNAWILAGQPENAEASLTAALELGDGTADVYADRARARGLKKDWVGAVSDLNTALGEDRGRADLLVLRASAQHALGRRRNARADIDAALDLDPHYVDALVERGAMKLEAGDRNGARADWQLVLATEPKSPAANSARMHIEQLELSGQSIRGSPRQRKPGSTPR
jgi:tetratricopeptide (TPR) repeat protein